MMFTLLFLPVVYYLAESNRCGEFTANWNHSLRSQCGYKPTLFNSFFRSRCQVLDLAFSFFCFIFSYNNHERNISIKCICNLVLELWIFLLIKFSTDVGIPKKFGNLHSFNHHVLTSLCNKYLNIWLLNRTTLLLTKPNFSIGKIIVPSYHTVMKQAILTSPP